ncbi:MAG: hypothetical protein CTY12_01445 [Methylotenera sp.]|nr:MAG: hypothetical protein CTY12_01445 [Methylotenera sp.]
MLGKPIDKKRAEQLVEKGALLIDVRDPVSFRDGSLKNAINLPLVNMSQLMTKDKNTKLIFFGKSKSDNELQLALSYAVQLKFEHVLYIND